MELYAEWLLEIAAPEALIYTFLKACQIWFCKTKSRDLLEQSCEVTMRTLYQLEDGPEKLNLQACTLSTQAKLADIIGDHTKAIELIKVACAIRMQETPLKKAQVYGTVCKVGHYHYKACQYEESERWYELSGAWWQSLIEDGDEPRGRLAPHLVMYGYCLLRLRQFNKAQELFLNLIPQLASEGPSGCNMLALGWVGLAAAEIHQQDYDAAEIHYIEAESAFFEKLFAADISSSEKNVAETGIKLVRRRLEITRAQRAAQHIDALSEIAEAVSQLDLADCEVGERMLRETTEGSFDVEESNAW
ncbi:uncharacterized protein LDX57_011166 [Aspergillus melleus]|uniref:uncharacterized protein n=1 Tax=Aspergillus melleus TaxID=138277 RepID=UPI001E8DFEC8|nr:uncharacterized protein LDX57_011166 [Aspergillus melleus]KAH8433532.1 hypothetical protein LDX57_011166 [Aspergillus melleus]